MRLFLRAPLQSLAEAYNLIDVITELGVKPLNLRLIRHDLQIQLRTSKLFQLRLRTLDERTGVTVAARIFGHCKRIHPSAMSVIPGHHRADQSLILHADE